MRIRSLTSLFGQDVLVEIPYRDRSSSAAEKAHANLAV